MKIYSVKPVTDKVKNDIHNLLNVSIKKLNIGNPVAITDIRVSILKNSIVLTIITNCNVYHEHKIIKYGNKITAKTYTDKHEFRSKINF